MPAKRPATTELTHPAKKPCQETSVFGMLVHVMPQIVDYMPIETRWNFSQICRESYEKFNIRRHVVTTSPEPTLVVKPDDYVRINLELLRNLKPGTKETRAIKETYGKAKNVRITGGGNKELLELGWRIDSLFPNVELLELGNLQSPVSFNEGLLGIKTLSIWYNGCRSIIKLHADLEVLDALTHHTSKITIDKTHAHGVAPFKIKEIKRKTRFRLIEGLETEPVKTIAEVLIAPYFNF